MFCNFSEDKENLIKVAISKANSINTSKLYHAFVPKDENRKKTKSTIYLKNIFGTLLAKKFKSVIVCEKHDGLCPVIFPRITIAPSSGKIIT